MFRKLIATAMLTLLIVTAPISAQDNNEIIPAESTTILHLTRENPAETRHAMILAHERPVQGYTLFLLDTTDFENGGALIIEVVLGNGTSEASYDLYLEGVPVTQSGYPEGSVRNAYRVRPDTTQTFIYAFEKGQVFSFGATGSWESAQHTNEIILNVWVVGVVAKPTVEEPASVVLTKAQPVAVVEGILKAQGQPIQGYTLTAIDTTDFESGGVLEIIIDLEQGESTGSFDLYPEGVPVPKEGYPAGSVANAYEVGPENRVNLVYPFEQGQIFNFGATGSWLSQRGATNTFHALIRVTVPEKQ